MLFRVIYNDDDWVSSVRIEAISERVAKKKFKEMYPRAIYLKAEPEEESEEDE
jgi:hypothetical protein